MLDRASHTAQRLKTGALLAVTRVTTAACSTASFTTLDATRLDAVTAVARNTQVPAEGGAAALRDEELPGGSASMRARLAVVAPGVPSLGGAASQAWRAGSDRACRVGRDLLIPVRALGYGSGMVDGELISRAGRILADAAQAPARVLVFGSHARGDARDGSDLDFLVIERDVANRAVEMVRLRDALPPLEVPVDVIVVSEQHVAKWGPVKGTLTHAALAEGRLVAEP